MVYHVRHRRTYYNRGLVFYSTNIQSALDGLSRQGQYTGKKADRI